MNIEARTMIDIASKHIIPAVIRGTKTLAETVNAVVQAGVDAEVQRDLLVETSSLLKEAKAALTTLEQVTQEASTKEEGEGTGRILPRTGSSGHGSTQNSG